MTTYTYSIKPCEDLALKKVVESHAIVMQGLGTTLNLPAPIIGFRENGSSEETSDEVSHAEPIVKIGSSVKSNGNAITSDLQPLESQGLTYIHSYEVRLVIEFCDRGTLRQGWSKILTFSTPFNSF